MLQLKTELGMLTRGREHYVCVQGRRTAVALMYFVRTTVCVAQDLNRVRVPAVYFEGHVNKPSHGILCHAILFIRSEKQNFNGVIPV